MSCYRSSDAEADEDGGGGDEINENLIGPRENRREGYSIVLVGAVKMCK